MKNHELDAQCREVDEKRFKGGVVMLVAGRDKKCWYLGGEDRAVIVWNDERKTHLRQLWSRINKIVKAAKSEKEAMRTIAADSEVKILWRAE